MIQKAHFILDVVWGCMRFILIYMCPISLVLRIWGYHKWVMLHTIGTQTNRLAPWYPICWLLITTIDPCWEWFRHTETKTYAHSLPQASHICPQWSVNRAPYIYFFFFRSIVICPISHWNAIFGPFIFRHGVLIAPPAMCSSRRSKSWWSMPQMSHGRTLPGVPTKGRSPSGAHQRWRRQGEKYLVVW